MAADSYADVSGLVERSAAAYASSVPEHPADDGFFGPGSVTWRLSTDLSTPIAGLRALMVQALHPLAMAGVDQHSDWRSDPGGPARRHLVLPHHRQRGGQGDGRTGLGTGPPRPRACPGRRRGDRPAVRGGDPALLLWVHAAFVDSNIAGAQLFGTPLMAADADRYVAEMVAAAKLVGVPTDMVPASVAELERYIESVRPILRATPAARESMAYLLDPPGLDPDVAEIWQDIREGTIASLPDWARDMYGYSMASPLTDARRTEIRQALGILDTVFLGEPGVLEARQRLTLRKRAARVA